MRGFFPDSEPTRVITRTDGTVEITLSAGPTSGALAQQGLAIGGLGSAVAGGRVAKEVVETAVDTAVQEATGLPVGPSALRKPGSHAEKSEPPHRPRRPPEASPHREPDSASGQGAQLGHATSSDYRATFFEAHPDLQGRVVVHHAVEQQVLERYPGVITEAELHSLEKLRGISNDTNSQLHLSQIRLEWNQFYRQHQTATKSQLLEKATDIDSKFGAQFKPPVGGEIP